MICPHCEFEIEENVEVCPYCQTFVKEPVVQAPQQTMVGAMGQPMMQGGVVSEPKQGFMMQDDLGNDTISMTAETIVPQNLSREEFFELPGLKSQVRMVKNVSIYMYVLAGLNMLIGMFLGSFLGIGWTWIFDVVIILGAALGCHIKKSRACAVVLVVFWAISAIGKMIMMQEMGTMRVTGFANVFFAISIMQAVFHLHKAWKVYEETGIIPEGNNLVRKI